MSQGSDYAKTELIDLGQDWAAAELRGDTAFLEQTLADDFVGIGPLGFMLTKDEWLQRHRSGDLTYETHDLDEVEVRVYGDAAVTTGRVTQRAAYRGRPMPGQFRTTLVWVRQEGVWRLAGLQFSAIAQVPAGMPPSQ
ncbi:MAG: nuclear transport factor 2 family protein [Actinobacteria bacterium]|nr:nuclear transport factor 2 family protein [Actinomycetota bacterium]